MNASLAFTLDHFLSSHEFSRIFVGQSLQAIGSGGRPLAKELWRSRWAARWPLIAAGLGRGFARYWRSAPLGMSRGGHQAVARKCSARPDFRLTLLQARGRGCSPGGYCGRIGVAGFARFLA